MDLASPKAVSNAAPKIPNFRPDMGHLRPEGSPRRAKTDFGLLVINSYGSAADPDFRHSEIARVGCFFAGGMEQEFDVSRSSDFDRPN